MEKVMVPLTVPANKKGEYLKNWALATKQTGRLLIFAADQKVEHLNDDFVGTGIAPDAADPEHYFRIIQSAKCGVMAGHIGLISRYGADYPNIPYIVKLNGKTNLVKEEVRDPFSSLWLTVEQVVAFKASSKLPIVGVGLTVYLGSHDEAEMLQTAAQTVLRAHQNGLLVVLWMYFKGKSTDKKFSSDPQKVAGAAGVALSLGADFAKVSYDYKTTSPEKWQRVSVAAGRTGVLFVGGEKQDPQKFITSVEKQLTLSGSRGLAVGRNIYQHPLPTAVGLLKALGALVFQKVSAKEALKFLPRK
jgi:fructose-bisphosphate aldolase/6-deoxy-5-ketofructose 1-phosphate synthase